MMRSETRSLRISNTACGRRSSAGCRSDVIVGRRRVPKYVLVTAEVQKPNRAYFGTRLLPTIKSDRHPSDDLRPHAVLEIRRNLLMNPHNAVILPLLQRPRPEDVGGLHTIKKQWANTYASYTSLEY